MIKEPRKQPVTDGCNKAEMKGKIKGSLMDQRFRFRLKIPVLGGGHAAGAAAEDAGIRRHRSCDAQSQPDPPPKRPGSGVRVSEVPVMLTANRNQAFTRDSGRRLARWRRRFEGGETSLSLTEAS